MKKLYIVILSFLLSSSLIAQNFEEITGTPFEGVSSSSIAFADIDNDGDQDVLITGIYNYELISKLYINDGDGNFEEVIGTLFYGVAVSSIAFADIDNDNDLDVLITGGSFWEGFVWRPSSKLYTNDGNGNFTEVLETPFEDVSWSSIDFADVDNDGDQDVLITGEMEIDRWVYGPIAILYTNDGNGNFEEVFETPFEDVYLSSIAFADIDNDNDQDVLITGKTDSNTRIAKLYTNDGYGIFTEVLNTPFEGISFGSIAFTDVDSDGDQDVLITGKNNSNDKISKLYTNDGNGNYIEVLGTTFEGVSGSSIAFADIDNDNDQDVLITGENNSEQKISKLYANDGNGIFTEVINTPFEGVYISFIAFADIDNDNDQDVLITGQSESGRISKLYQNMTIVGINENALFRSVSIFPNPNKRLINIDLGSLSDVSIKVLNVSGQMIYYKENIYTPKYQFELDAAPGIYILELSAEGEKQQFKLIKN